MLSELVVENLGPIASTEIVLQAGSSALTGETGAGKTLLVTAVGLLAGGRAERGMVRDGAEEARVEGRFVLPTPHAAVALLAAHELCDPNETELVISRSISPSASRVRVNGRMAPVAILKAVGPALVEIAGQHEHHRLSSARAQREVVDIFAGTQALAAEVAALVRELDRTQRDLDDLRASEAERARELDILGFETNEIADAGIKIGEYEELTAEAERLEHAEELGVAIAAAVQALSGDAGADDRLDTVIGSLERISGHDPAVVPLLDRVTAAAAELRDIAGDLSARATEPDPAALATIRDRLGELARLRRKYGADEREVLTYLAKAQARIDELTTAAAGGDELGRAVVRLRDEATKKALELSQLRSEAAPRLAAAVEELFATLALEGARFVVGIEESELYEGGLDAISFEVSTGAGEQPRPLTKIASGGELSRIALALHLVARDSGAATMIFDEVDAGVGGAAARAVGAALARLGRDGAQVLVVTHLPQVAAFADAHYRVVRRDGARRDVLVERVERDDRVEELSRMLAGLPESDRAREHAQELLDLAATGAAP